MPESSVDVQRQIKGCFTYAAASQSASDAAVLFEMAADNVDGAHSIAFVDAAVISYGRPYSGNFGLKKLGPPGGLTQEQQDMHKTLNEQRNEAVAHSDPGNIEVKVFSPGPDRWLTMIEVVKGSAKDRHRMLYWDRDEQMKAAATARVVADKWQEKLDVSIAALDEELEGGLRSGATLRLPQRLFQIEMRGED